MLTGLYSYGQAARLTHAYAAALSSTVDPIRSAPLATEHHPGQQQRHRQHRRRPMPIWVLKKILKTDTIPRSTRLTILCTVYQTRKNTMQQYDLLSRFSVHFEQPRAVIINFTAHAVCAQVGLTGSTPRVPGGSVRAIRVARAPTACTICTIVRAPRPARDRDVDCTSLP